MEITGKIIEILPEEIVRTTQKELKKRIFVIETLEQFPRKIAFTCWNTLVDQLGNLQKQSKITVTFRADSREYNGRWYTELTAVRISLLSEVQTIEDKEPRKTTEDIISVNDQFDNSNSTYQNFDTPSEEADDLPF